jgi:hypothetical protein
MDITQCVTRSCGGRPGWAVLRQRETRREVGYDVHDAMKARLPLIWTTVTLRPGASDVTFGDEMGGVYRGGQVGRSPEPSGS